MKNNNSIHEIKNIEINNIIKFENTFLYINMVNILFYYLIINFSHINLN